MLKIIPLGGLGEIGLNMMVFEYDQTIMVIDAGLMFPEEYMPGVDMVIPDFSYLEENRERVKGIILTHGHEDHIGAVPFLLKRINAPVYGTNFTIELLKEKLSEYEFEEEAVLNKVKAGEKTSLGPFTLEYIAVNHSIIDGVGLAIETPEGIIIHSGDFKIDYTPVDGYFTDLNRFAHYGKKDVLMLFSDSTNIEKEGFTLSEMDVRETLEDIFQRSNGRLIVAVFASNIARIGQIIDLSIKFNRKIVFSGKSMKTNVRIAENEGCLTIPDDIEISEKAIKHVPDDRVTIITTGSQGEPMSSLTRMAGGNHKDIHIGNGDTIILSSRFIPGNEKAITSIINSLYRQGAQVIYEKVSDIHTSGHAHQEELKLMLSLVKPRFFIPIHGEYRHLVKHTQLAGMTGLVRDNCVLAENGDIICCENGKVFLCDKIQTGRVLVDGKGVGDVGELVLRDRRKLSGDGIVIVLLALNDKTGGVIYGPDIVSRGFVFEDQKGDIIDQAKVIVMEILDEIESPAHIDRAELAPEIKRKLKRYFFKVIERSPMILPIIIPV